MGQKLTEIHLFFDRGSLTEIGENGKYFCDIIAPAKSKILMIPTFSDLNLMIRVVDVPNRSLISGESVKNRNFSSRDGLSRPSLRF